MAQQVRIDIPDGARAPLAHLIARHPNTLVWYGTFTRGWWAMVGGQLVEKPTPFDLDRTLSACRPWGTS